MAFVNQHRRIADRFRAKAEELFKLALSLEDIDERVRIACLMEFAQNRAALHASMARLQDIDMGVKCHCPLVTDQTM